MYNEYKIQHCINFKFWTNMLGESLCTLTGWCMTQYIITILWDIVDHKIYSARVFLKSANRFNDFPISNLSSSSYAHLIAYTLYISTSRRGTTLVIVCINMNIFYTILYGYREIRRQLLPHEKPYSYDA